MNKKPIVSILIVILSIFSVLLLILILSIGQILLTSCTMNESSAKISVDSGLEKVTIPFPAYPPDHPPPTAWRVVYEKDGKAVALELPGGRKTVDLVFEKNVPSAVLVFPLTSGTAFFKPAGCIYPFFRAASWEHGFASEVLLDILTKTQNQSRAKALARTFNWQRLCTEIDALSAATGNAAGNSDAPIYNPWNLSKERIITAILTKNFSKRLLNQPQSVPVQIALTPINSSATSAAPATSNKKRFFLPYLKAPPLHTRPSALTPDFAFLDFAFFDSTENLLHDGTHSYIVQKPKFALSTGITDYTLTPLP
ncbi:MAG: hypothetical protein Ta2A_06980 [Treponemataceae bacterium]|nr:MAG: hypothetical protein Ta2A_06980 [Treponemataceae bacterium]